MGGRDAIDYAKEVYAACATVGFESATVARLKSLLDDAAAWDIDAIVEVAAKAQREAVHWAGRSDRTGSA